MDTVAVISEQGFSENKVELDNTYNGENESGYSTQQSMNEKTTPDWENFHGEITDASTFDPPIWCSSNVNVETLECDFSTIANANMTQGIAFTL